MHNDPAVPTAQAMLFWALRSALVLVVANERFQRLQQLHPTACVRAGLSGSAMSTIWCLLEDGPPPSVLPLVWDSCRWMKGRDLSKVPGLSCRSGRFVPMAKKDGTPLQVTYQIKETEDENGQPGAEATASHICPLVCRC